jgi:STE24 endopeptidase
VDHLGAGGDLASALKKLSADSLANLTPHPFYVALHYTHPPLARRVARL